VTEPDLDQLARVDGPIRRALDAGTLAVIGAGVSIFAILWPYEGLVEVVVAAAIGAPILVPLYVAAIWVAADCANRRLARSADPPIARCASP
jgi:hypothetical protein